MVLVKAEANLTNLAPFSNYSIYVSPYSSKGAGPRSEEFVVATLESCRFITKSRIITKIKPRIIENIFNLQKSTQFTAKQLDFFLLYVFEKLGMFVFG